MTTRREPCPSPSIIWWSSVAIRSGDGRGCSNIAPGNDSSMRHCNVATCCSVGEVSSARSASASGNPNASGLPVWLSDALCRLASGGSFALRQLYTDAEEVLFQAARPVLLNGIEDVVSRPDLGDRAIFLTLTPIGEAQRRSEAELWHEFEIEQPRILRPARRGGAWPTGDGSRSARLAAAHGRLRPLGHGLRNSAVACRHIRSRLRGKSQSRHGDHHRSRPHSHLRACNHGRPDRVDRERVRPLAFVCGKWSR